MMHATTDCGAFVMDIVVWLRSLGLGKYEAVFRENDIDKTVLPNLTAEDLKELGVTSLGHRRKLLDAIAALRSDGTTQEPSSSLLKNPRHGESVVIQFSVTNRRRLACGAHL